MDTLDRTLPTYADLLRAKAARIEADLDILRIEERLGLYQLGDGEEERFIVRAADLINEADDLDEAAPPPGPFGSIKGLVPRRQRR